MSKHEDAVKAKIDARCAAGMAKYGVTVERTDLTRMQWLQHAQDEAMDLAIYLQRLIADESSVRREAPAEDRIDWAAYPRARWAAADEGGDACMFKVQPTIDQDSGRWHCDDPAGSQVSLSATIPGPWTESLRKRPENA